MRGSGGRLRRLPLLFRLRAPSGIGAAGRVSPGTAMRRCRAVSRVARRICLRRNCRLRWALPKAAADAMRGAATGGGSRIGRMRKVKRAEQVGRADIARPVRRVSSVSHVNRAGNARAATCVSRGGHVKPAVRPTLVGPMKHVSRVKYVERRGSALAICASRIGRVKPAVQTNLAQVTHANPALRALHASSSRTRFRRSRSPKRCRSPAVATKSRGPLHRIRL